MLYRLIYGEKSAIEHDRSLLTYVRFRNSPLRWHQVARAHSLSRLHFFRGEGGLSPKHNRSGTTASRPFSSFWMHSTPRVAIPGPQDVEHCLTGKWATIKKQLLYIAGLPCNDPVSARHRWMIATRSIRWHQDCRRDDALSGQIVNQVSEYHAYS